MGELRKWGLAMAVALSLVGVFSWFHAVPVVAGLLWLIGGLFAGFALVRPQALSPLRRGFERLTAPIRWVVSTTVLTVVFYALLTPLGLVLRWMGKIGDGPEQASYWEDRDPERDDPRRAFRQS